MVDDGNGSGRRKPHVRTAAERASIVAETYKPGATVAGVARRHGIVASQLSGWRTAAKRKGEPDKGSGPAFAELSVLADALPATFDGIEIVCGAVSIRLPKSTAPKQITYIARGLAQSK
ncbi:transposase [Halocynthiibacter namhaensis]|uniref:transposase n=1 Tax=Halocynthiibacter namhaensis TaxID=1290553 RepID=UPI00057944F0|nr:transposase [Halocynthiibacter namhaensis]